MSYDERFARFCSDPLRQESAERLHRRIESAPSFTEEEVDLYGHTLLHSQRLTGAERDTLRVMAHGQTESGAAELLSCSDGAIQHRLKSARRKLRAKNTTHAVARAIWTGEL